MAILDENGLEHLWAKMKEYFTKDRLGLGNVDNTSDTNKYVAYAQRAGEADKTKYKLTLRINGGRTEGSNMWTFDGSTSRSVNITPAKIGAVEVSQGTENAGKILWVNSAGEVAPLSIADLKALLDSAT